MSEQHFVTRTADGLAHGNTLALRRLWTVIVYIDVLYAQADGQDGQILQDSWHLVNDDGLYDKTLQRSEAVQEDEKHLEVRFTEVVPEGTYSLYHCLPSGTKLPVFLAVPFAALEDHGEETPEPSNEAWTLPVLTPEPEPLSDDPLLLRDLVDYTLDPTWYSDFAWYRSDPPEDDSAVA